MSAGLIVSSTNLLANQPLPMFFFLPAIEYQISCGYALEHLESSDTKCDRYLDLGDEFPAVCCVCWCED